MVEQCDEVDQGAQGGYGQHAAIAISIINSMASLSQSVTWACVGLDVGFPDARAIMKTGDFVSQDVRGIKKTRGNTRKLQETHF